MCSRVAVAVRGVVAVFSLWTCFRVEVDGLRVDSLGVAAQCFEVRFRQRCALLGLRVFCEDAGAGGVECVHLFGLIRGTRAFSG